MRRVMTAEERALARAEREKNHAEQRRHEAERRRRREELQSELKTVMNDLLVVRTLLEHRVESLRSDVIAAERSLLDTIRRGLEERDPWTENLVLGAVRERESSLRPATEASHAVSVVFAILGAGEGPEVTPESDMLVDHGRNLMRRRADLEQLIRSL
jgi:hypothetical protein